MEVCLRKMQSHYCGRSQGAEQAQGMGSGTGVTSIFSSLTPAFLCAAGAGWGSPQALLTTFTFH